MRAQPARWQWSDALDAQLEDLKAGALDRVSHEAERLLSERPQDLEAIYLAGRVELVRGEVSTALARFSEAASRNPDSPLIHHGHAFAQEQAGDARAALVSLGLAIEHAPSFVEALVDRGYLQLSLNETAEAFDDFNLALAFDPRSERARDAMMTLSIDLGHMEAAEAWAQEWLAEAPTASAYRHLARLRGQQGRTSESVAAYEHAIRAAPGDPAPVVNLGLVRLLQLGDAPGAEALFRQAVELRPDLKEAQANLGLAMQAQGRFEEALQHYERLIEKTRDFAEYRWNRGIARLTKGNFEAGWDDYELRKRRRDAQHPHWPFPEWDGAQLRDHAILVYAEQGLGDEIMFASCLPDVVHRARACVVQCDSRLTALYRRSFSGAHVHGGPREGDRTWMNQYPRVEVQCAIGSLPRFVRRHERDFAPHAGYLKADPASIETWKRKLQDLGPGINVGFAWQGGTLRTAGPVRSIPLATCVPLLRDRNAQFISLQRGDVNAQIEEVCNRHKVAIHQFPEAADFDQLAALVASLDLVIAVPSTVAHLAGALGRPVWILVARPSEWRYLWNEERMPWYPSARLFRQEQPGEWTTVLGRVSAQLRDCAQTVRGNG